MLLTGCNQHYPKWYYEAQLSGPESHSCQRAIKKSDDNSKRVADVCEVAISNAIISLPEYQKTDTPPKIQPLESADDIKAMAFKAVSENRYSDAITFFGIAISLEPDNKILYHNRGEAYFMSKEYEEALVDFDKAIAIDPSFVSARYYRGDSNYNLKRYNLAIIDFTKVIMDNPNDASAFFKRAYSKTELGDTKAGIDDYNQAITLDPNYSWAYNNRGYQYSILGQYETAITNYNKAIEINPNYGIAFRKLGQNVKAKRDCERANRLQDRKNDCN